uniref:Fucosyltransferase n=1 Tax=Phallusia mammillata TaxID=59560 RepID=A0A6F9DCP6_9ASCI|nr:alpha-(1,3)-fucosyltransferase 9-like [Phallusia mammillata]
MSKSYQPTLLAALSFLAALSLLYYIFYLTESSTYVNSKWTELPRMSRNDLSVSNSSSESTKSTRPLQKVILYWSKGGWFKGGQAGHPGKCGNCPIVRDRQRLTDPDTAAVIFPFETNTVLDYPQNNSRRADQLYIWWSVESPSITQSVHIRKKIDLRDIEDNYFNGTITCRKDSLIPGFLQNPLQQIEMGGLPSEKNLTLLLAKKNKTAIWFASNCNSGSNGARRIRISEQLIADGLSVDRFGRCFNNRESTPKRNSKEFFKMIEPYRFYLAFENSLHCRGYITEKFFTNGLMAGAVPIVSGATREDYKQVAPPHSYIHVEDFNSTKELVEYLKYLESNETAYAEYFAWRTLKQKDHYPYGRYAGFCALCRALYGISVNDTRTYTEIYGRDGEKYDHKIGFPFKEKVVLKSLHDWWYGTASKDCLHIDKVD